MTQSVAENVTGQFEAHRDHLRGVAYRMLGSLSEADDALQDAWLKVSKSDARGVANMGGWLTTIVARVCLDMLRARAARREDSVMPNVPVNERGADVEAVMADSVGLALLVVLDTLAPAERVAFVLHDLFELPFDDIAPILQRSLVATRQLASRARRRLHGPPRARKANAERQHAAAEAFLAASRTGDMEALLALLDPDVVLTVDGKETARGARNVGGQAAVYRSRSRFTEVAIINGSFGFVVAPLGRYALAMEFAMAGDKISEIRLWRHARCTIFALAHPRVRVNFPHRDANA